MLRGRRTALARPTPAPRVVRQPEQQASAFAAASARMLPGSAPFSMPQQLLGLQRTLGNQAVQSLLGGLRRNAPASSPRPVQRMIQRKLKFKPDQLAGHTSLSAGMKGVMGKKSTYTQIHDTLKAYWAIPDSDDFDTNQQARAKRLDLLRVLDTKCKSWLKDVAAQTVKKTSTNDIFKEHSIKDLAKAVEKELADEEFRAKYSNKTPGGDVDNSVLEDLLGGRYAFERADKKAIKHGMKMPSEINAGQKQRIADYVKLKGQGLTHSEILAIYAYTGDNYELMNPAMAGDKGWMKANMASRGKKTDTPEKVDKAMEINKDISKYATAGLDKLPPWKQTQTIYRGETVSQAEGDALGPGKAKTYPHFVSTSLELTAPRTQIGAWVSKERPYKVIYHITDTSQRPGKDVALLAKSGSGEKEILFAPGTTFVMGDIVTEDAADNYKEIEVHTA